MEKKITSFYTGKMNEEMYNQLLSDIGTRIRSYRREAGLTIEQLAEKCNPILHYNYLGAVERGGTNISIKALYRIAEGLNIPVSHLLPAHITKNEEEQEKLHLTEQLTLKAQNLNTKTLKLLLAITKNLDEHCG